MHSWSPLKLARSVTCWVAAVVVILLGLTGCGGDGDALSPSSALAQAKDRLNTTSGVSFTLATDAIPEGETGPLKADGVLNRTPAFKGEITLPIGGMTPSIKVVAVDGTVWAQLPLVPGWQEIDPSDYGVPDPAKLIDPDVGIPSLLTATTGVTAGDQTRGGVDNKEILTVYSGTLPGDAVANVIASATGDFAVDYTISDAGVLSKAVITGDFYGTGEQTTYTVTVADYDSDPQITAP